MANHSINVVEQEFDALASGYDTNRLAEWYQAHAKESLKHCDHLEKGDVLDVGCATGYFLHAYLKDKPNVRAVGIDASAKMIAQAQQLLNTEKPDAADLGQVKLIHANWENFDLELLKDYKFKAIFCANTFHYFTDPQAATDKLFKLLENDGTLYLLERNKAFSPLTLLWGLLHKFFIKDQVVFYKASDLVRIFEKSGLSKIEVLSSIKKYFWKNKIFTSIVLIRGTKK